MHNTESRALKRAVVVLILVSSARWVWAQATPEPQASSEPDVLDRLLMESVDAAEEEAARSRPLEPGERIDPNRANEVELDRLPGVGPAIARAIVAARDGGLSFRRAEDLATVTGIGAATVARLRPLLDLRRPPPAGAGGGRPRPGAEGREDATRATDLAVDVNTASVEALTALPGIGPALAERIVVERRKQMFSSVEDLQRVQGIGPATVKRLRGHVRVPGGI